LGNAIILERALEVFPSQREARYRVSGEKPNEASATEKSLHVLYTYFDTGRAGGSASWPEVSGGKYLAAYFGKERDCSSQLNL